MNKHFNLYYLYCTNVQCNASIYHRMMEIKIPLTAENLMKTHVCTHCDRTLVSAIDMEIKHVMTSINSGVVEGRTNEVKPKRLL